MTISTTHLDGYDFEAFKKAIAFEQRSVVVYGKTYPQPRLTKWYGPVAYEYSGLEWPPCKMPDLVESLREKIETISGHEFNCCLCNLYRTGKDRVGWHSDDEDLFGPEPAVASFSLGATRRFVLRRKDDHKVRQDFHLSHGTLLVMGPGVQSAWQHTIPEAGKNVGPRINLTFRKTIA